MITCEKRSFCWAVSQSNRLSVHCNSITDPFEINCQIPRCQAWEEKGWWVPINACLFSKVAAKLIIVENIDFKILLFHHPHYDNCSMPLTDTLPCHSENSCAFNNFHLILTKRTPRFVCLREPISGVAMNIVEIL